MNAIKAHKDIPLFVLFLAGLFLGIFVLSAGGEVLLEGTGLLDESSLYQMKYTSVEGSGFLAYVLGKRLGALLGIIMIASTYLGVAVMYLYTGWLGFSFGMLLTTAVARYGIKGILLTAAMIFPQYMFYVPAYILLLRSGVELCRTIYFPGRASHTFVGNKKQEIRRWIITFLKVAAGFLMGAMLESYVNPKLVIGLLKIF